MGRFIRARVEQAWQGQGMAYLTTHHTKLWDEIGMMNWGSFQAPFPLFFFFFAF